MVKRIGAVLLAVGVLPHAAGVADAGPITHAFSGIVHTSDIVGIDIGDLVNGWIAFDTSVPDGNADPNVGTYVDSDYAMGLLVGSFSIATTGTVSWWIWNDCCVLAPLVDAFDLLGTTPDFYLAVHGLSDDLAPFDDTSVPTSPLSGDDFWFNYILGQGDLLGGTFEATLTSIAPVTAAPEPGTVLLVGAGLWVTAFLAARRRRPSNR